VSALPPDLKARVMQAARATPSPTRAAARTLSWLVLPSSVIVAGSLYFAFGGPDHGAGRAAWFYVASSLGWAAVAALSTWSVLARGRAATGRPTSVLWAIAAGTPAALFALMFALVLMEPTATLVHPERVGYRCFGLTVAAAAFPLLALLFVRRGSDAVHPVANGAALGAACGASAGVMVEMWCPVATPAHVAFGHVAPIVLLAALGAALGMRVLAIRAKPRATATR
jgi:hypothetical protein